MWPTCWGLLTLLLTNAPVCCITCYINQKSAFSTPPHNNSPIISPVLCVLLPKQLSSIHSSTFPPRCLWFSFAWITALPSDLYAHIHFWLPFQSALGASLEWSYQNANWVMPLTFSGIPLFLWNRQNSLTQSTILFHRPFSTYHSSVISVYMFFSCPWHKSIF